MCMGFSNDETDEPDDNSRAAVILLISDQAVPPESVTAGGDLSRDLLAMQAEGIAEIRDGVWRLTEPAGADAFRAISDELKGAYMTFAVSHGMLGGQLGVALGLMFMLGGDDETDLGTAL